MVVCFAKNNDYTTNVTANQGTGFANSHLRSIPVKVHGVHGSVSFIKLRKPEKIRDAFFARARLGNHDWGGFQFNKAHGSADALYIRNEQMDD